MRLNQTRPRPCLKLSPRSSRALSPHPIHPVEELCLKKILWRGTQEEGCCPLRQPVPALPPAQPDRNYVGFNGGRKWAEAGRPLWFRVNSAAPAPPFWSDTSPDQGREGLGVFLRLGCVSTPKECFAHSSSEWPRKSPSSQQAGP